MQGRSIDGSYTYSWYKGEDLIVDATSTTYQPGALTAGATYTRKVADGACNTTPSVSTGGWTVTVIVDGCPGGGCSDGDGNSYKTVIIGDQEWMAENLKAMHRCGNSWNNGKYGRLYDWDAAMNCVGSSDKNPSGVRGICPRGWHLPSDAEWTQLSDYLTIKFPGIGVGTVLKSTSGWYNSGNGTDNVGFCGLPGGECEGNGKVNYEGDHGCWRASTERASRYAWLRILRYNYTDLGKSYSNGRPEAGDSVRCVKD